MKQKALFLLIIVFFSFTISYAQSKKEKQSLYIINQISDDKPIRVGGKLCYVHDTISLNKKLSIGNSQIVILKKVVGKTKKIIKGNDYNKGKFKNIYSYLFPTKYRDTRSYNPEEDLVHIVGQEILWVDSLCISTTYHPSYERYFIMEIENDSTENMNLFEHTKVLCPVDNNISFILEKKNIWNESEPKELYFNLLIGTGHWYNYKKDAKKVLEHIKLIPFKE